MHRVSVPTIVISHCNSVNFDSQRYTLRLLDEGDTNFPIRFGIPGQTDPEMGQTLLDPDPGQSVDPVIF